jgi:hypothetical protein
VCFSAPAIALRRQPRQPVSKVVELPIASPGFYVRVRWACEVQFYDGESPHTTQRAKKQRMRKSKRRQTYPAVVRNYPRDDWGRSQADKTRANFHGGARDLRPIGRFVNQFLSVLSSEHLPRVVRCGLGAARACAPTCPNQEHTGLCCSPPLFTQPQKRVPFAHVPDQARSGYKSFRQQCVNYNSVFNCFFLRLMHYRKATSPGGAHLA